MTTKYSSYLVKLKVTLLLLVLIPSSSRQNPSMAVAAPTSLPGCPDKCGNVVILYPFGTKDGCFLPGFQIICNDTFQPPRAFFPAEYSKSNPDLDFVVSSKPQIMTEHGSYFNDTDGEERRGNISMLPVEIISFSVAQGKLRVRAPFCYKCRLNKMYHSYRRKMEIYFPDRSPFFLSKESTVLMGIGYKVVAQQQFGPSCEAVGSSIENGTCFGRGCCQAILLPQTNDNIVIIATGLSPPQRRARLDIGRRNEDECTYAMLVDKSWYNFTSLDLDSDTFLRRNDARGVPVVVDFVMANHSCPLPGQQVPEWYACARDNTVCVQVPFYDDTGYLCNCSQGYQGNPYIPHGCRDIDECEMPDLYPCHGICHNREGGYECACPAGTKGNATQGQCTEMFPLPAKAAVGAIGCLFVIALVVFFLLLRRQKRKMKHFFMKNGGPALEKANNIKIYRREELKPILRSSNFIGKGCFGEVYKGYLDNRLVAVKKPITDTVAHNEQFANEVIIQSRVIHKNIVRLIGCCLEVDIPMLVYEFLSNGSLDDTLHSNNKVPLDIDVRFNIAAESAEGLAYMHSKTGNIILHGDVKPANILLNDDYVPKISDFGISRLIARDKEHTTSVIGDRTYMDPVYLQTGLLTEKSDVYSFGVLLLELVSRRKATYSDHNSLVRNFVDAHKKDEMPIELFDKEFVEPRDLELLGSLARVAVECLNLDVDERPAMTDVAERLLMLKRSRN